MENAGATHDSCTCLIGAKKTKFGTLSMIMNIPWLGLLLLVSILCAGMILSFVYMTRSLMTRKLL